MMSEKLDEGSSSKRVGIDCCGDDWSNYDECCRGEVEVLLRIGRQAVGHVFQKKEVETRWYERDGHPCFLNGTSRVEWPRLDFVKNIEARRCHRPPT